VTQLQGDLCTADTLRRYAQEELKEKERKLVLLDEMDARVAQMIAVLNEYNRRLTQANATFTDRQRHAMRFNTCSADANTTCLPQQIEPNIAVAYRGQSPGSIRVGIDCSFPFASFFVHFSFFVQRCTREVCQSIYEALELSITQAQSATTSIVGSKSPLDSTLLTKLVEVRLQAHLLVNYYLDISFADCPCES